jgi:hypothetical protein
VDRARLDMIAEVVGEFIDSDGMKMWPRIVLGMVPGMMDKVFSIFIK